MPGESGCRKPFYGWIFRILEFRQFSIRGPCSEQGAWDPVFLSLYQAPAPLATYLMLGQHTSRIFFRPMRTTSRTKTPSACLWILPQAHQRVPGPAQDSSSSDLNPCDSNICNAISGGMPIGPLKRILTKGLVNCFQIFQVNLPAFGGRWLISKREKMSAFFATVSM